MNKIPHEIVYFVLIAGRKQKDDLLAAMTEGGGKVISLMYGRGSVKASYLQDVFGFVPEENKVIITCLMAKDKSEALFKVLVEEYHFNQPNTGIAFTIPVGKLSR